MYSRQQPPSGSLHSHSSQVAEYSQLSCNDPSNNSHINQPPTCISELAGHFAQPPTCPCLQHIRPATIIFFQESMTAVLPATIISSPSSLRKPRPFSRPTTNLLSIMIPIQPLKNSVIQSIMTPPPPRSPPTPTTTRLTTVSNISFTRQYFFRFRFPTLFTQLLPFIFNTEFPFIFVMAQLLSTNQINHPNKYISNKSFPTNPFSTISEIYILSSASLSSFSPVSS